SFIRLCNRIAGPAPTRHLLLRQPPTSPFNTLSLHDALPISRAQRVRAAVERPRVDGVVRLAAEVEARHEQLADVLGALDLAAEVDRKSTRLNSSHVAISYAVFCLKKKVSATRPSVRTQTAVA